MIKTTGGFNMYYFVKTEVRIEKYSVDFDKEELEKLRLEIINNCSEVTHHEYDGIDSPSPSDYLKIRNYSAKKIDRIETNREFGEYTDLYHFRYDEWEFPHLVKLIDGLLKSNKESVLQIMNPDYNLEKSLLEHRISKLSEEIDTISNLEPKKKIEKLNELQELMEKGKLNNFKKSVIPYYQKVQDLLTIELVDSIDIQDLLKIQNFFEIELKDVKNTDNHIQKILTI